MEQLVREERKKKKKKKEEERKRKTKNSRGPKSAKLWAGFKDETLWYWEKPRDRRNREGEERVEAAYVEVKQTE